MKLLMINADVHLITDHNPGPETFKESNYEDLPNIPKGFVQTVCGRTVGGGDVEDQRLDTITCDTCKSTAAYEQAELLEQMIDEG